MSERGSLAAFVPSTRWLGRSFTSVATTSSTMDDARLALAGGAPSGHLVVADAQTNGRGTHGRAWSSPTPEDLYLSFAMVPDVPLEGLATLALAVGLAVARTVDELVGAGVTRIKWPNDVLVGHEKIAGILVESQTQGERSSVVVGIGLNVNREAFPPELAATSVARVAGHPFDRAATLGVLVRELEAVVEAWTRDGSAVVREVTTRLHGLGCTARLDGAPGIVRGLTAGGALRFEVGGVEREIFAGRLERSTTEEARE